VNAWGIGYLQGALDDGELPQHIGAEIWLLDGDLVLEFSPQARKREDSQGEA